MLNLERGSEALFPEIEKLRRPSPFADRSGDPHRDLSSPVLRVINDGVFIAPLFRSPKGDRLY